LREIKGGELDEWINNKNQIANDIIFYNDYYNNLQNFIDNAELFDSNEEFAWNFVDENLGKVATNIHQRYEELNNAWNDFFVGKEAIINTPEKRNI